MPLLDIEGNIQEDKYDLGGKADFVEANTTFNDTYWSGELLLSDSRWQYGTTGFQKINTNTQQIQTLAGVRDTLLLEVMRGEVRAGD